MNELLESLRIGDEIYWTDPDQGLSSGYYTIIDIVTESGTIEEEDTVLTCSNGDSYVEIFAYEIE